MLSLVHSLQKIWAQKSGESDAEYRAFLAWLQEPNRKTPTKGDIPTAMTWQWSERASAFDKATAIQQQENMGGTANPVVQTVSDMTRLLQNEANKYLNASYKSPDEPVVPARDLVAIFKLLQDLQKAMIKEESGALDLSKATEEEMEIILEGKRIIAELRNRT